MESNLLRRHKMTFKNSLGEYQIFLKCLNREWCYFRCLEPFGRWESVLLILFSTSILALQHVSEMFIKSNQEIESIKQWIKSLDFLKEIIPHANASYRTGIIFCVFNNDIWQVWNTQNRFTYWYCQAKYFNRLLLAG